MREGRPILLDLFCKAGGATKGYQRAGFYVIGVDIEPQPNYCGDRFIQADALAVLRALLAFGEFEGIKLSQIAAIHASPPCQAYSDLASLWPDREHPELIAPTRDLLVAAGLPYVIENVSRARRAMIEPVLLCGSMFGNSAGGRQLRRHRLFECSFPVLTPTCRHEGQPVGVYGHGGGGQMGRGYKGSKAEYQEAMEMPWATKTEIAQAIPPSYTEFIGSYLEQAVAIHA